MAEIGWKIGWEIGWEIGCLLHGTTRRRAWRAQVHLPLDLLLDLLLDGDLAHGEELEDHVEHEHEINQPVDDPQGVYLKAPIDDLRGGEAHLLARTGTEGRWRA